MFNGLQELTPDGWRDLEPLELRDSEKSLFIRWGYKAVDEEKTFLLDWTVIGLVKGYSDVAEFYWKVIEDNHERIQDCEMRFLLPKPSPELFKVYISSRAKPGELIFNEEKNEALVKMRNIPRNSFVAVRLLAQPGAFSELKIQPVFRYQKILFEEERDFYLYLIGRLAFLPLGILMMLIFPTLLFFYFYFRYGREPKVFYEAIYEREPPRRAPPVTIPIILNQKPEKERLHQEIFRGMLATLLDLAREGIVNIRENPKMGHESLLVKREKVAQKSPFHQEVANFFFGEVSGGGEVFTEQELKRYATKNQKEFLSFLTRVSSRARSWWEMELKTTLLDPKASVAFKIYFTLTILSIVLGAIFFGTGFGILLLSRKAITPLAVVPAVILIIPFYFLGKVINRWDEKAYLEHKRWVNFKKFLIDFSALSSAPVSLLPLWEEYYVYAVALGVGRPFLKNILELAKERGEALSLPTWYIPTSPKAQLSSFPVSGFETCLNNVNNLIESFSTKTTYGGGFSGGGGGAGGGGRSGAG